MVVTSGIWKPSLLSGAQSLCLFCVECCSTAMDTYLKRKSMTHIWSSHLFLPKPERLKCLSVSRCPSTPPPARTHTHTHAGSCTTKHKTPHTNTHNQPTPSDLPLSSFCNPSIFLTCHSTVKDLFKTLSQTHTLVLIS